MSSPKNKESLIPTDWDYRLDIMSQENRQTYFNAKVGNLYARVSSWEYPTNQQTQKEELNIFLGARVGQGKYTELTFYRVSDHKKIYYSLCHGEVRIHDWFLISKKEEE